MSEAAKTNSEGETIDSGLMEIYRHVIPVGNGRYRLSRETKEPLVRDK